MVREKIVSARELAKIINKQLRLIKVEDGKITLDLTYLEITFDFVYTTHVERVLENKGYSLKEIKVGESETKWVHIKEVARAEKEFKIGVNFSSAEFKERAGFMNAAFSSEVNFRKTIFSSEADFSRSEVEGKADFLDAIFKGKSRFHHCDFKGETNFENTKFNDLADFYNATFYKKVIFNKTDFLGTTVFSAVTFEENVLFTYSLIKELLILRGAECQNGFDISLAIIPGELGLFDFSLENYSSENEAKLEKEFKLEFNKKTKEELKGKTKQEIDKEIKKGVKKKYEDRVTKEGIIPTKNKRETFRILKNTHIKQNNIVESLEFKKLEKIALNEELGKWSLRDSGDKIILWLNKWSNNHGTSYIRAFLFILLVGMLFFNLSLLYAEKCNYAFSFNIKVIENGMKDFLTFINPLTHSFDYIGSQTNFWFFFWDFFGRIFVGYGIYQFIQAFRKYR